MCKSAFSKTHTLLAATLAALLLVSPLGCESEQSWQDPGPAATFERFLFDWYRGDRQAAFEAIAPEDRRRLLEPRERLGDQVEEQHLPESHEMLVAGRVDNPYDLSDIELQQPLETEPDEGQRVSLELVYHDGREGSATMVWGGERWYVDLPLPEDLDSATGAERPQDAQADPAQTSGGDAPDAADAAERPSDAVDAGDEANDEEQQEAATP